jgi:hypothetical protein
MLSHWTDSHAYKGSHPLARSAAQQLVGPAAAKQVSHDSLNAVTVRIHPVLMLSAEFDRFEALRNPKWSRMFTIPLKYLY